MTMSADDQFRQLVDEAQRDPVVVGLVLGGSRGKGFHTPLSDYDLYLIVRDEALDRCRDRYESRYSDPIDLHTYSYGDFTTYADWDTPLAWARYGLARARILIDKDGRIGPLVAAKGRVPEDRRLPLVRGALDAYVNSVYRSAKCWRNCNALGAQFEAGDSLGHLLTVLFALEGRHRPYYGYLERELRAAPLKEFPLPTDELLRAIETIRRDGNLATQQALLGTVEAVCREAGCGDLFDAWGETYRWTKSFRPGCAADAR
jgi:hypothetical protein